MSSKCMRPSPKIKFTQNKKKSQSTHFGPFCVCKDIYRH